MFPYTRLNGASRTALRLADLVRLAVAELWLWVWDRRRPELADAPQPRPLVAQVRTDHAADMVELGPDEIEF